MAKILLSDAEKTFILHGIQENLRTDGRACMDYRLMELETDVIPACSGSAHLRIGNTDLLACVKAELDTPDPGSPAKGRIEIFVDCSPAANPDFEGRGGEEVATDLTKILKQAYDNPKCLDLNSLCIIPGVQVWVLYVDILILECGGNLFDAASIAVKSALFDTKIPSVTIKNDGESGDEIEVSDDPYDVVKLDLSNFPCLVTLLRTGSHYIVDATSEEEACSTAKLIMAVSPSGAVMMTRKNGSGSLHPDSILDVLETGQELMMKFHAKLIEKLKSEANYAKEKKGFLT